jgi:two-component system sensor histidine kinase GlrK
VGALPYPRSFLGLLLAGFLLVALPLAGALAYSAWNTERLAVQSRDAVVNAAQAARASRSLVNRIGSIERLAQQVAVLEAPELLADLARVHRSFQLVTAELDALALEAEQRAAIERTVALEQSLYDLLAGSGAKPDSQSVARRAGELADVAHEVLAISYLVADREVERLRARAETVQRRLILLVLFATALALSAALALSRYIARPIARLDAAIRQLGDARLARPIRVPGPEDLRSLGQRLDWLRRRLRELEEERNRFLRHLSHELKTPLAALREGAELLGDQVGGPLAPPQRRVVSIMRDNSVKLQRMIEELLDFQRALHASATLALAPVRLDELAREAARAHELAARAKCQRLVLEARALTVEGDAPKLRSILENLVGNAVKFAPRDGTVTVLVAEHGAEALVEVIDSGPGVPPEEREAIFDTFFRGRPRQGARIEGSGLGLAIAREFAEAHGGQIRVVGEGRGGHFQLVLPRRASEPLREAA